MTLDEAVKHAEATLPGWSWLVRTDTKKGYMAIIHSPRVREDDGEYIDGETTFARYGADPAALLMACVNDAAKLQE